MNMNDCRCVRDHAADFIEHFCDGGASSKTSGAAASGISAVGGQWKWWAGIPSKATVSTFDVTSSSKNSRPAVDLPLCALHQLCLRQVQDEILRRAGKGCTHESPIRVERYEPNQVGWNGDGWVYASACLRRSASSVVSAAPRRPTSAPAP